MKGRLIVIEGVDGSGKETQSKLLFDSRNYGLNKLELWEETWVYVD